MIVLGLCVRKFVKTHAHIKYRNTNLDGMPADLSWAEPGVRQVCALQLHNACPGAGRSLIRTVPPCTANARCTLSTRIAAIVTAVQFRPMDRDRLTGANFLFSKRSPILVYQKLAEQTGMIMDELSGPADPHTEQCSPNTPHAEERWTSCWTSSLRC